MYFEIKLKSAIYGLLATIMDSSKNDLPVPISFGIHFFCCIITKEAALLNGYVSCIADVLAILIPTFMIYVVICGICFLLMKKNEREINRAQENK